MRTYLPLVALAVLVLACSGTTAQMQILDEPVFVCPTAIPRATNTPMPTSAALPIVLPPGGWATLTPYPGCSWNGYVCAPNTPYPGGMYTTPAYTIPGATSTPRPTYTPYPSPTPFVMRPPQEFYIGDPVYTGGFRSSPNIRLRLLDPRVVGTSAGNPPRAILVWGIEIRNLGISPYEVFPAWQSYVSALTTSTGELNGIWGASQDAAEEAGLNSVYETVALAPGETRLFALAAYTPLGAPRRIAFVLDPTTRSGTDTPGNNVLMWGNSTNPACPVEWHQPGQPVIPTPIQ